MQESVHFGRETAVSLQSSLAMRGLPLLLVGEPIICF